MSCRCFNTYPFQTLKRDCRCQYLAKAFARENVETHRASLTSFASDTIGIGTRFRTSINLGVYDKVYRAFPAEGGRAGTGYKRQGLLMPVTG